jgi:hypothetical protein
MRIWWTVHCGIERARRAPAHLSMCPGGDSPTAAAASRQLFVSSGRATPHHRHRPGTLFALFVLTVASVHCEPRPTVSWVGSLSPTSVRLAVQPSGETATLVLSTRPDLTELVAQRQVTREAFIADFGGLIPETLYYYVLVDDAGRRCGGSTRRLERGTGELGQFKTPSASPRAPFRIAVGSCSWAKPRGNGAVFANIVGLEPRPLFFIHAGDLHYRDIGEDLLQRFEAAYHSVHAPEADGPAQLFRTMPVMYTWDDHDYGANDADGSSLSKSAALTAYRKYVPATLAGYEGPAAVDGVKDGGIFQSYEIQGVLFVITGMMRAAYCM